MTEKKIYCDYNEELIVYRVISLYFCLFFILNYFFFLPEDACDGNAMRFATFLRDLLTYDLADENEALGIFQNV